jgi:hypothetical protein
MEVSSLLIALHYQSAMKHLHISSILEVKDVQFVPTLLTELLKFNQFPRRETVTTKILKIFSGSSPDTDLSNMITISQSQSPTTVPLTG